MASHIHFQTKRTHRTLVFGDGIVAEPSDVLQFEGYFENGYRQSKGKEYDTKGNILLEGPNDRGMTLRILSMEDMDGYWKEIDKDNNLVSSFFIFLTHTKNNNCYF